MHFSPESVSFEANSLRVEASKAASNKYAAESMLYLTAGLWDLYANTNIDTETAILKVIKLDCKRRLNWKSSSNCNFPLLSVMHVIRYFHKMHCFQWRWNCPILLVSQPH